MIQIATAPRSIKGFRVTAFAFACILCGCAVWILLAQFICPQSINFPIDTQSAKSAYVLRDKATRAARVGLVRGDLWSQAAFSYGDYLWNDAKTPSSTMTEPFERTRELTLRAIGFAPHDSRLWLLLGAINTRFDWLNDRASADLRMSFYTGSNLIALVPARLLLSVQARALKDDDFQELVRHDIRIAVIHKSDLLPALIAAYNNAPQGGQQFIQKAISELDPSILPMLYSAAQPH